MVLETEREGNREITSESDLRKALESLGPGNEFLILSDGDRFIQCAGTGGALYFEYTEGAGVMYTAQRSDVSLAEGEEILGRYFRREDGWKEALSWSSEDIPGSSHSASRGGAGLLDGLKGKSFTDMVKNEAVREIKREMARKTSGTIGKLIRKITR